MHPHHSYRYPLQRIIWIRQSRLNLWRWKWHRSPPGLRSCLFANLSGAYYVISLVKNNALTLLSFIYVVTDTLACVFHIVLQLLEWSLVHALKCPVVHNSDAPVLSDLNPYAYVYWFSKRIAYDAAYLPQ
jgi:hypothetical protein